MVKASNEAFKKQLKLDEEKKTTLKKAIADNQMEGEVRKIMKQEQTKEDQSTYKKQVEQTIRVQLQKENAHKEVIMILLDNDDKLTSLVW